MGVVTPDHSPPEEFIARWDLDKTYLRTEFDTMRDLVRTAFERPDQKRAVPGAAALLRELGERGARIHILSGSPRQMRPRLEEKLRIDRVRWDELTLKPNLSNALRLRFRAVRDQLGYKLPVLLEQRTADQTRSEATSEVLVGDDAEADAFVYFLYAEVCAGRIERSLLSDILRAGRVYDDVREACLVRADELRHEPVVERILIHLDRQSPPSRFDRYGSRVVPFYNYLQAAFVLAEDRRIGPDAVLRIASEFVLRQRFDADALARSYADLARRGRVQGTLAPILTTELGRLQDDGGLPAADHLQEMCRLMATVEPKGDARDPLPEIDFVGLARVHAGGKNRRHGRRAH